MSVIPESDTSRPPTVSYFSKSHGTQAAKRFSLRRGARYL